MRTPTTLCLWALILAFTGTPAFGQILFNEVSVAAGVGSDHYLSGSGHGLGINWIDYDNDGWPDLFTVNGSDMDAHLYHNDGTGTFTNVDELLPVLPNYDKTGAVYADYDNDGDLDIYMTIANGLLIPDGPANALLQNQWVENGNQVIPGQPLFIDVAAAAGVDNLADPPLGTLPGHQSYNAGWFDYDQDSCIDLFVGNMVFDYGGDPATKNALYHNNCDGTFTDVTVSSGVNPGTDASWYRPTLAFFGGIMDPNDLLPDLYIINVHDLSPYHFDFQFRNNGDGTFENRMPAMPWLGDDSGAGMGIDLADIDHDGDWDIYITDLLDPGNEPVAEGNTLYLGNPDGTWDENSAIPAGVKAGGSWGTNFMDLDHDGFEELFVGAGDALLYQNNTDGTFTNISAAAGMLAFGGAARGTAVADYDRDGDLDLAIIFNDGNLNLYQNVSTNSGNWFELDLEATVSNRAAIGTLVEVTAGGVHYMRQVKGGSSAHSQDDLLVHFGVAEATTLDEVKISWPSGIVQILTNVAPNQRISLTEGGDPPSGNLFTDVSASAGVAMTHDGAAMAALGDMRIGTGAAWFDYDNDGDLDLYTTMRTSANMLWQNNGDGTFTDVAAAAGVQDASHDGSGVAVADYNNDGCKDLYVANGDEDVLYENNCDGTFTDITAGSGLEATTQQRGTSASWGDYDNDGFVDLFVANHIGIAGSVISGTQGQDYLFHNNGGDGTFTDVSDALLGTDREGMSFIGGWTDYDNDGDLDIYKINDCPFSGTAPTKFFRNDGGTDGVTDWTFTEASGSIGADWCQNGMGLAMGDFDHDGDSDYFFTDNGSTSPDGTLKRDGAVLLRNDGATFTDVSDAAGTANTQFSWGGNFFDFDLDGWQDLYMAAGGLNDLDVSVASILWQNNGDGTFTDVSGMSGGLETDERTRTSVYGDYDGDGDPDMFLVNFEGAMQLFRNDNNNGNKWLIVDLEGTVSNRDGIGARITATTPDAVVQYFQVRSGSSLGGGDDLGAYFGLGTNSTVSTLQVTWPSGTVQTLTNVASNQRITVVEDGGGPVAPNASFTYAATDLSVDFTDTSTDSDGTILSWDWDFDDGNASTEQNPTHAFAAAGTYSVSLTVTDSDGLSDTDTQDVTVSEGGGGTGAFLESGGMVVFEAEHYHTNTPLGDHEWVEHTGFAGFSGSSAMQAQPDVGTRIRQSPETSSPEMTFDVLFSTTGTYHLWLRLYGFDQRSNKAYAGIDGVANTSPLSVGTLSAWTWTNAKNDGLKLTLEVSTAGVHTISIWMADDGASVDKAVMTTDAAFIPTGEGPAESPKDGGGPVAPNANFTYAATDLSVDFTDTSTDSDGTIVSWDWDFDDGNASTEQNPTHAFAAAGTYSVSLTVTDSDGLSDTETKDVTVSDIPADGTMHVESITTVVIRSFGTGTVEATVLITDNNGAPVADATVAGTFGGDLSGTDSGVTDANGEVVLVSDSFTGRPFDQGICVDTVTHATLVYDPLQNADTSYDCATAGKVGLTAIDDQPTEFELGENYPNPFNPSTTISFALPEAASVSLAVYDMLGRRVATLVERELGAGRYAVAWDGRGDGGSVVASGLYLVRLQAGDFVDTHTMMLLK